MDYRLEQFPHPVPSLNICRAGEGPRFYAVWLDHRPVFLDGLKRLPHLGDRFEIDGQLWRVVEIYDRIICEREPSQSPADRVSRRDTRPSRAQREAETQNAIRRYVDASLTFQISF